MFLGLKCSLLMNGYRFTASNLVLVLAEDALTVAETRKKKE